MSCPRIFLIRHGESLGNVDKMVHHALPDHAIGLSDLGKEQALKAGKFLDKHLNSYYDYYDKPNTYSCDDTAIWTSPYLRTRQTADHISRGVTGTIGYEVATKEHINLVEQQFGLFDGFHDGELKDRYPDEYAHYNKCESFGGKFFARMPLGESRFDVAVRVHQFFGTLMRDVEKHDIKNIIIVSHGVTNRAFAMQWLHLPFEWFEKEPNPKNCSIRLLEGDKDKGYIYNG